MMAQLHTRPGVQSAQLAPRNTGTVVPCHNIVKLRRPRHSRRGHSVSLTKILCSNQQPNADTGSNSDYTNQPVNKIAQGAGDSYSTPESQPHYLAANNGTNMQTSGNRRRSQPTAGPNPYMQAPPTMPSTDQFAAFRAFQQLAALQAGSNPAFPSPRQMTNAADPSTSYSTRGQYMRQGGYNSNRLPMNGRAAAAGNGRPYSRARDGNGRDMSDDPRMYQPIDRTQSKQLLQQFRTVMKPKLQKGWYAQPSYTVESLHDQILSQCDTRSPGLAPLYHLLRLASCQEHMRTALSAFVAVRSARARHEQELRHMGPKLAQAFVEACVRCDAPDVLAETLVRANEAGLELSYASVHEALRHWAAMQELHKVQQVLAAMPASLPHTTKTAYIVIRGAVNAGRQEMAEELAEMFVSQGIRLHDTTRRLLELGRQRSIARQQALAAVTGGALTSGQQGDGNSSSTAK